MKKSFHYFFPVKKNVSYITTLFKYKIYCRLNMEKGKECNSEVTFNGKTRKLSNHVLRIERRFI